MLKTLKKEEKYGIILEVDKKGGLKIMEIKKKMYKYTAIISMTIVLMLIFNLMKPMLTIADSTYGISSINYDKNEEVMTVTCTRLDEHVNSFLYWVSTEEEIPTKDNLDELAVWCVSNAVKVVPLNTTSLTDSIKIRKTGKYYAIMLLKKADEEGKEEYVKAFVANYVVNTPIKEDNIGEQEVEEELAGNDEIEQEILTEPDNVPEQETIVENEQEIVLELEQQLIQENEQEQELQQIEQPEQQEQQLDIANDSDLEEDKPLYVQVNNKNEEIEEVKEDEYVDVSEEKNVENEDSNPVDQQEISQKDEKREKFFGRIIKIKEDKENKESRKLENEEITEIENQEIKEIENEEIRETQNIENTDQLKPEELPLLTNAEIESQAQEDIPQTGANDMPVIIGIIAFSIIGLGSFVKYLKIK